MSDTGEERGIGRGATPSHPEMKEICNADD